MARERPRRATSRGPVRGTQRPPAVGRPVVRAPLRLIIPLLVALGAPARCAPSESARIPVTLRTPAAPTALRTDLGYEVTLDEAFFNLGAVELLPCAPNAIATVSKWVRPSVARAHIEVEPGAIDEPFPLDWLASGGGEFSLGALRVDAGAYCGVRMTFIQFDDGDQGLPTTRDGTTSVVGGRLARDGETLDPGFAARVNELFACEVALPERLVSRGDSATLRLDLDPRRFLDGLVFEDAGAVAEARALRDNTVAGCDATWSDPDAP